MENYQNIFQFSRAWSTDLALLGEYSASRGTLADTRLFQLLIV